MKEQPGALAQKNPIADDLFEGKKRDKLVSNRDFDCMKKRYQGCAESTQEQQSHSLRVIADTFFHSDHSLLLPKGISCVAHIEPESSSDHYFDFYRPADHLIDFCVGKVEPYSGGLSRSNELVKHLVTSIVRLHTKRFAEPHIKAATYVSSHWGKVVMAPLQIVTLLLEEIEEGLKESQQRFNFFYCRWDLEQRIFTYVDCGLNCLIIKTDDSQLSRPESFKPQLLQICKEDKCKEEVHIDRIKEQALSFCSGDLFFFFSAPFSQRDKEEHFPFLQQIYHSTKEELFQQFSNQLINSNPSLIPGAAVLIRIQHDFSFSDPRHLKAQFHSHLSQLKNVREFIEKVCHNSPGNTSLLINQLQLAVNEIFTNIVKHGYEGKKGGCIAIESLWSQEGIEIDIFDQGVVFDPSSVPEPNLYGSKESGFGWYIIKSIADEITYIPKTEQAGWNHLKFYKKFIPNEASMKFNKEEKNNTTILTPCCENLDAKNAREFKQKLLDLISEDQIKYMILDMSSIQYVDSSGLGSLLSVLKSLHAKGGDLKLVKLNKPVRTIFELVAMHKIFEIYNNSEEALHAIP